MTPFVPKKCLQIVMKITDEEDAIQYLKEYIKYIQNNNPIQLCKISKNLIKRIKV